jgi:hypothetical protein
VNFAVFSVFVTEETYSPAGDYFIRIDPIEAVAVANFFNPDMHPHLIRFY